MSGNQESQAFMTPIGDEQEAAPSSTACGCFRQFCLGSGGEREPWWRIEAKKMRELSEHVAGPKWKNLWRKIGRYYCNPKLKGGYKAQFIYDAHSYALNFDDGGAAEEEEDDGLLRNFSSRYAAPAAVGQQGKVGCDEG